MAKCETCNGKGKIKRVSPKPQTMIQEDLDNPGGVVEQSQLSEETCPSCQGSGEQSQLNG